MKFIFNLFIFIILVYLPASLSILRKLPTPNSAYSNRLKTSPANAATLIALVACRVCCCCISLTCLASLLPSLLSSLMFVQLAPSLAMTAVAYRRCAYIISNADIGFARLILISISPIDWITIATR